MSGRGRAATSTSAASRRRRRRGSGSASRRTAATGSGAPRGERGLGAADAGCRSVAQREDDPLPFDRFRNRVMFPIADMRGRVIASGPGNIAGRAGQVPQLARDRALPEAADALQRTGCLDGGDRRQAGRRGGRLSRRDRGRRRRVRGAVALLGTALTEDHVNLLWRMSDQPILCFDGDEAGQRAAARVTEWCCAAAAGTHGADRDAARGARSRRSDPAAGTGGLRRRARAGAVALGHHLEPRDDRRHRARDAGGTGGARGAAARAGQRHFRAVGQAALHAGLRREAPGLLRPGATGPLRRPPARGGRGRSYPAWPRRACASSSSDTLRNSRLLKPGRAVDATSREAAIIVTLVNHPGLIETRMEALAALDFVSPVARG